MASRFRKSGIALTAILTFFIFSTVAPAQPPVRPANGHPVLAIGSPAPDFSLPGVDGKVHKLSDYKKSPYLMVLFICDHCPTSQMYEFRIMKLVADYKDKGVAAVAIQPNDPSAIRLSELGYTDVSDSLEEMKIRAAFRHFNFPYLYDGETQSVSNAFGVVATPHVYIFDKERKLRYEGRVDNAQRESLVKTQDARAALDELLAGKPVTVTHTGAFGCSTKWKSKIDSQVAERKMIEGEPVKLDMVTADDLKKLRSNPANKVTVVSFWSTSSESSVKAMAGLLETYRMFRRRDFDLLTVSMNNPDDKDAVMKVLQEQHAASRNLLFDSTDTIAMETTFDARWNPAAPFTMALAPGGRVIYEQQGDLDVIALRRAVLSNMENETYRTHPSYWATR
ncbi:MAG TPA: thioredoxin family protein [Bryobacteraceae bacterium]|nr:thioredoxin family protein [Bryobacteraceae bacterium]